MTWMIYGANGYTGRLVAEEAVKRGLAPVLAGRTRAKVEAVARELGLSSRVFDLRDEAAVASNLDGIDAVLSCAGPFSATIRPMLEGCRRSRTHYLDITGEIEVFEHAHLNDAAWKEAGIVAMPGVGFDVVPSDCLAAMLKRDLPDATRLTLAFQALTSLSPGTAKTTIEGLRAGGLVRRDGAIVQVPPLHRVEKIELAPGRWVTAVCIPWGDVSTAYYSTGIPNVEVLMGVAPSMLLGMRIATSLRGLVGLAPVQAVLKKLVGLVVKGPSTVANARAEVWLWGEARNATGGRAVRRVRVPGSYPFTVDASLACMKRILAGEVEPGARTPSMAFGPDFVLGLDGVRCERVA